MRMETCRRGRVPGSSISSSPLGGFHGFGRFAGRDANKNGRDDMYAQDSIDLLAKSGIDFARHEEYGIDVETFGELLMSSGLVLLDDVKWVSFHRCVSEIALLSLTVYLNRLKTVATTLATS